MYEIRQLKANEIDVRVGTAKQNGISLLLYKDARADMNVLDECVGQLNWQRHHTRDNANCILSIWDSEKKQWIEFEDTGKESNAEKEKGLASDSFKRACVNLGIGRSLYSAPFIWINSNDCNITEFKGAYKCNDGFLVEHIAYDENKDIKELSIKNKKTGKTVYKFGIYSSVQKQSNTQKEQKSETISSKQFNEIQMELARTGVKEKVILDMFKLSKIMDMGLSDFAKCIKKLKVTPDENRKGE